MRSFVSVSFDKYVVVRYHVRLEFVDFSFEWSRVVTRQDLELHAWQRIFYFAKMQKEETIDPEISHGSRYSSLNDAHIQKYFEYDSVNVQNRSNIFVYKLHEVMFFLEKFS